MTKGLIILAVMLPAVLLFACGNGDGNGNGECQELPQTIDVDTILEAGCYLANDDTYVSEGAKLTLEPGVEIIFSQDASMNVSGESALNALGTADDPIVFTGDQEVRGFWDGVIFTNANSLDNQFDYVTVEYAGASEGDSGVRAGVALDSSGFPVRLSMTNSTVRQTDGYGFYLRGEAVVPDFSNNTMTENAQGAGYVIAEAAGNLDDTTTYVDNDNDLVFVECAYGLATDQTWPGIDVDYHLQDSLIVSAHLTIAPDARLVFLQDAGIKVDSNGALTAVGTAAQPVLFTGQQQDRGYWRGISFTNSNSGENKFEYATIEYGGGYEFEYGLKANLFLSSSGYPVRVSVKNSNIRQSASWGFHLPEEAVLPEFTDNQVTQNADGAGYVLAEAVGNLDDSTSYQGNDQDVVFVECAYGLETDQTWPAIDVDYLLHEELLIYSHLTIAPGARLVFQQDAGLDVEDDGMLTAVGTATQPIIFTGELQQNGYWCGIYFSNSNHVENQFDYVTLEYAGGYEYAIGQKANIFLDSSGYAVSLDVTNSTIQHSGGWGAWLAQEAVTNLETEASNTFADNTDGDIFRE